MLRTERLLLRRPTDADVESPPARPSDPEVMGWLGGIDSPTNAVRRWLDDWERFPTGKFLVERRSDGALVGRVVSSIAPDNVRSRRVAERLGAVPEQTVQLPGYGQHLVWVHPR